MHIISPNYLPVDSYSSQCSLYLGNFFEEEQITSTHRLIVVEDSSVNDSSHGMVNVYLNGFWFSFHSPTPQSLYDLPHLSIWLCLISYPFLLRVIASSPILSWTWNPPISFYSLPSKSSDGHLATSDSLQGSSWTLHHASSRFQRFITICHASSRFSTLPPNHQQKGRSLLDWIGLNICSL